MNYSSVIRSRGKPGDRTARRRVALLSIAMILSLLTSLFPNIIPGVEVPTASAHNLQTRMVSMFMDSATQGILDARMANPGWTPPDPLLQSGDELGLIIKVVPRDGTTTGVGGHIDFYVPTGVQVTDVGYVVPDGAGGFTLVSMKGQSPIAIGDGPIGAKSTSQLVDPTGWTGYTNINGVTETPVVPASGLHRGTIAGVYGDTGIFYSTDPDTAYGSWQKYTGDWNATNPYLNKCGSLAFTAANGKTLVNNSGDTVVPCNKWDAEQLMAWGVKGGTFGQAAPIVDYGDGRGNAPWGFAAGTGGPQSGYKWNFDWDEWQASGKTAADMRNAMGNDEVGPWQRIQYRGSRISKDQPGLISTALGYASIDGSNVGASVPLLATTSQTDATSPKAIRWAVGQLTAFRPEYAWVKIKVNSVAEITNASGCPVFKADTFGGDAGGSDNGKDHLWRYYEPTEVTWNGCLAAQKTASREIVKVGDTYQYKLKVYNFQNFTLSSVKVTDPLPSGVTFLGAVPAQNSGPNPLVWNVGTLLPGQKWEATVTVKAASTGFLDNCINVDSGQLPTQTVCDSTVSGSYPYLVPSKSVTPTSTPPGGTVTYDVLVKNTGTGPTGNPVVISDFLPAGLTYDTSFTAVVTVNGASVTSYTLNTTNPSNPIVTVPVAINAGSQLTLRFKAIVPSTLSAGTYCNTYTVTQSGIPLTTGSEACLKVDAGTIGDTVFRDWDGDGVQDPEDEGLPGVTVTLKAGTCPGGTTVATATTDASGKYLFSGLSTPATYCVDVVPPAGYTLTTPPEPRTVSLAANETNLTADFGYKPGGAGSIGDTVFEDVANNGVFDGSDVGIPGVSLTLYEDTNGNGIVDAGQDAQVATTTSGACPGATCGVYSFTNLDPTRSYVVVATDGAGSAVDTYFANPYVSSTGGSTQSVKPADFTAQANAVTDADFGYFGQTPGSIGDTVCRDSNVNKLCDAGEPGIPNVTVSLYLDADGDGLGDAGELVTTTTTDITGKYLFPGLGPGAYVVQVDKTDPDVPDGYVPEIELVALSLAAGQNRTDVDFPFVPLISKSVDKANANAGDTLNFTTNLNYQGSEFLSNVRVVDPLPTGTNYVSANMGGTYGAFSSASDAPGVDDQDTWSTGTTLTVAPTTRAIGNAVTVSMVITSSNTAATPATITNVTPTALTSNGGSATCGNPSPLSQNLPKNGSITFAFTCTPTTLGEFTFTGGATGTISTPGDYTFAEGTSNSVLVSKTGSSNVVVWNLGSNDAGTPGVVILSGTLSGIYAFQGGNTKFWRYETTLNSWTDNPADTANNVKKGGALTYDGTYVYGFRGDRQKTFYRYTIGSPGSWTTRASTSDNVDEGGALQYLNVGSINYIYALLGNSNRFRRYSISGNSWSNMANTPASVKKGGALTTDGTYIYALQGDTKTGFWRYNPVTNTWTAMANVPGAVGWGGALTRIGNYIYATRGDGKSNFYRYDIAANTWTSRASTPGNVADGGALTTDITYVYAFQGKTNGFWRYDPAANTWAAQATAPGSTAQGAALVFVVGTGTADRTSRFLRTRTVVNSGEQIPVTMELVSNANIATVTPSAISVTGTGGASATCGSPTPASQAMTTNVPAYFTWTCTVTTGTTPGTVQFAASATGTGGANFNQATSNTVLAIKPLTFQVTIISPNPGVNVVENVATVSDSGTIPSTPSNLTQTVLGASIGDFVWADLDGDGVQDSGEPGIPGVKVLVTGPGCSPCTAFTDSNGNYVVPGLAAGSYTVTYDLTTAPGYIPTTQTSLPVTLTTGQQYKNADFGLQPAGQYSIGDTVWLDSDNGGTQNGAEPGLANVPVKLYRDADQDGIADPGELLGTKTTDADGKYLFTGLQKGDYIVVVDESAAVTSPYDGATTIAASMDPTTGTFNPRFVTVINANVADADFGYNWAGSIGDYVWWDNNINGLQDESPATPIANAYVLLYFDVNGNGILDPLNGDYQVGGPAVTDSGGNYLFDNLPPGKYLVDVYEDSITTNGVRNIVPTTTDVVAKTLGANEDYLAADFGYYVGALVQGNVFWDENRNGLLDGGEQDSTHLLENVTVSIVCLGPNGVAGGGDDYSSNMDTGTLGQPDGHYKFIVPPGPCTVTYSQGDIPTQYGDETTPTSYSFTAQSGEDWHPSFDFGVDNTGVIGDTVWYDIDGDGVGPNGSGATPGNDNTEPGLTGVTVRLYRDSNNNNSWDNGEPFLDADVTDANGKYLFEGLSDGNYVVVVDETTLPAGFGQTYDNVGLLDATSQADIVSGNTILSADFGYKYTGGGGAQLFTISGRVYNDANNNSNDDGETGFANVDVTVVCNVGTFTVQTDVTGAWFVAGIPSGNQCTVLDADETDLLRTDYVATEIPPQPPNQPLPFTVTGNISGLDFGYNQRPGSISGTVCMATDGDGVCQSGEAGISNVPVALTWFGPDGILGTGDDQTSNTTTNAQGDYSFTNLQPGLYRVVETNLPGYTSLADRDGGDPDNISPIVLPLGGAVTDRDFEDNRAGGVTVTKTLVSPMDGRATISDTVKFEIVVKNTGTSLLTTVPLWDYYSPACLENPVTTPAATGTGTNPALGVLHWPNLAPAGGLPAGQQVVVTVDFHANITDAMYWKEGGWIDYAPKGMPDFDQKQDAWDNPAGSGGNWFFCGPVAAANSLWWFDSKFEPNPVPPPAVHDGYPLVQSYAVSPASWDDHDPQNVQPFVNALAPLMGTTPANGTNVVNMRNGIQTYLNQKGLANNYTVTLQQKPTFEWVESEVRRSEDVILLLGFYQEIPGLPPSSAERVGGHYVTVAGIDSLNKRIGFSDPYRNAAEAGDPGRVLPNPHPYLHPAQPPDEVHNNAKYLSHDVYNYQATLTPGGIWGPQGYVLQAPSAGCPQIANFQGQNGGGRTCLTTGGGPLWTEVEYAVAVSPKVPTITCDPTTNIAVVSGAEDEFGLMLPEEQAHAQVKIGEKPGIGVAKNVANVTNHGDGTYTVEYSILVQNTGNTVLNNVQVTDNLAATFTGATGFSVVSVTSTDFTVNANYNGGKAPTPDTNLLAGTDSLAVAGQGTIVLKVKVTPGSKLGTYNNTATGSGVSPLGATVTDDSQDGVDTDPDTSGLTPADNPNPGDDNVPTPVAFSENPVIGIAKKVDSVVNNGNGTYLVTLRLTVENFGNVVLNNLTVTDDIVTQFAGLSPTGFTATSGTLTASGSWNGTSGSNILAAGQSLAVGASGDVKISFTVTPGYPRTVNNTANARGTSPAGTNVTDQSTVGTDPDPDDDKNPANNTTPTPVTFAENPRIGVAKAVQWVDNLGGGQYRVTYLMTVKNYGDVTLSNVQVTDNLATTFTGATGFALDGTPTATGGLNVNASYTGTTPNTSLLVGSDTLAIGASGTITVKVLVTPGANLGPYNNRATATGDSPAGVPVTDQSQNGTNPDPDNDNNPGNNNDPTPVTFEAKTQIGVAKAATSVVNRGDGTYDVTYSIFVANMGDTQLQGVQVTDNLNTTFGAGKHAVQSVTSTTFTVNSGYNGNTNLNLLAGTDTLNAGASGAITLVVRVTPGSNLGPYNNQARGTGTGPGGVPTVDNSQNGTNPDPDGDGDPTNNNVQTPVAFTEAPAIGVAKRVVTPVVNNGDGTYTVQYSIVVQNVGDVVLKNVQVTDDLAATFTGATSFSIVAGSISATGGLTVNSGFDGNANKNLLAGTNSLAKLAEGTITFKVKVTPGANLGPYNNNATGSGTSPAGQTVSDVSTDGVDTDTDTSGVTPIDNPAPGDDLVPTPVSFTEAPLIGVAKALTSSTNNGNGTYTVVYTLLVKNYGDIELRNVQVTDDLSTTFAGAASFSVTGKTSATFTVNGSYNGSSNINLLAGTDKLAVGAQGTIVVTVLVTPGGDPGPYWNLATATADSPRGTTVTDDSQNGSNPDFNGNGNPTDDTAETPVLFAENPMIGIAKSVASVVSNGNGTQTVTYQLTVENLGDVNLSSVQVTDNLASTFPAPATFTVNSITSPAGQFTVNASYNGSTVTQMLATGNTLAVGAVKTITVVVTVTPGASSGPYNNQARADAQSPTGKFTYDFSDNGTDPDPNGNGDPTESGENDPTPVAFVRPAIGAAKILELAAVNNGDGTYDVTYSLVVQNLGDVALSNVQLTDDLNATFGAGKFTVLSKSATGLTVNAVYNGDTNIDLLAAGNTLVVGGSGTVTLVVRVTPGSNLGPYNNQAFASGTGSGITVTDPSDLGTNPDPDGDKNANEAGENDPTPVTFTENPRIGLAKRVVSSTNNGDGTFTVEYNILVQNVGDIELRNVQVTDNLATTFAGATFTVDSVSSAVFSVDSGYTGATPNINLLDGTDTLAALAEGTITLKVVVRPSTSPASHNNLATGNGTSPKGTLVTDNSTNGNDTDPDTGGVAPGDNPQPGDNSVPTPVTLTQTSGIRIVKTGPASSSVGATAVYNYAVTNTGDVRLGSVAVTDVPCGNATYVSGDDDSDDYLDLTETWSFTCSYVVQATDPDPLVNVGTATGVNPLDQTVSAWDDWSTSLLRFSLGDFVWWDIDADGLQDQGEPGIPGVTVDLYSGACPAPPNLPSGSPAQTTVTDGSGAYGFTGLGAGSYCVVINAAEFGTTGTLKNWIASPQDVDSNTKDAIDSDGHPVTHAATATVTQGTVNDTVDFGFTIESSYTVVKELLSADPTPPGTEVVFKITIENTGDTWLTFIPLEDTYSPAFLTYGFAGAFATPADSVDHANDGILNWTDLTAAVPYGFGTDLAPGLKFELFLHFTAYADTTQLGAPTINKATVKSVSIDPDGPSPSGPLPELESALGQKEGSAGVNIYVRTGVEIASLTAEGAGEGVLVAWETASEANIVGFNLLRLTEDGGFEAVNSDIILAEKPGSDQGASYSHLDAGLPPGTYTYVLQIVRLDGTSEDYETTAVATPIGGG